MMKKITAAFAVLICLTCFAFKSQAQGNLQFNQIIFFDMATGSTQAIAVPAGKVWKIETTNSYNGSNSGITIRNSSAQAIAVFSATSVYPFWLPAAFSGSLYNSGAGRSCISIIEFNVVP